MEKLKPGRLLQKDLAAWFGIKPKSLSQNKQKWYEELSHFCTYHIEGKTQLYIDVVYTDTYVKPDSNYQKVKEKVDTCWNGDGLDTCKHVGNKIIHLYEAKKHPLKIADTTVYRYVGRARNELYGKPFESRGELGSCKYVMCKKIDEEHFALLTSEEKKIEHELYIKYFGDVEEKATMVKAKIADGTLEKEHAWQYFETISHMNDANFLDFMHELSEATGGYTIIRGTLVERQGAMVLFED